MRPSATVPAGERIQVRQQRRRVRRYGAAPRMLSVASASVRRVPLDIECIQQHSQSTMPRQYRAVPAQQSAGWLGLAVEEEFDIDDF
jgi:hypothetical protein